MRLLNSGAVNLLPYERQIIEKILQAEEVSLDVHGVRERTLRITRLPQFVPEGNSVTSRLVTRWLFSQLKVSLRPIWMPAGKAIAVLSERCGDVVWEVVFDELQSVRLGEMSRKDWSRSSP